MPELRQLTRPHLGCRLNATPLGGSICIRRDLDGPPFNRSVRKFLKLEAFLIHNWNREACRSLSTGNEIGAPAFGQDAPIFGTTLVIPAGLHGTVYLIPNGTTVFPDFHDERLQRVGELWTNSLNVPPRHWSTGFPGLTDRSEWFAIDYDGRFWIDKPGRYAFALLSDDGSRLFIDNVPPIDNDCQHPPDLRIVAAKLEGGAHRLRVSYFQGPFH